MGVIRVGWRQLLDHPEVLEAVALGSTVGLMAYHGGLEAGTAEIARAAATASGASLYTVEQPIDLRWHVASALVDPDASPPLGRFVAHVGAVITVHGYGRPGRPADVLVGGSDRAVATLVASVMRAHLEGVTVVDDIGAIPLALRGLHPDNPVNLPAGGGAQVELPLPLRCWDPAALAAALAAAVAALDPVAEAAAQGRPTALPRL